jgi:hypothetical protein
MFKNGQLYSGKFNERRPFCAKASKGEGEDPSALKLRRAKEKTLLR